MSFHWRWLFVIVPRRFFMRLRYAFRLQEIFTNEYESCDRCGRCYNVPCNMQDTVWLQINGSESGCLCLECIVELAQKKGIQLSVDDIRNLWVFSPDDDYSDVDLIGKIG